MGTMKLERVGTKVDPCPLCGTNQRARNEGCTRWPGEPYHFGLDFGDEDWTQERLETCPCCGVVKGSGHSHHEACWFAQCRNCGKHLVSCNCTLADYGIESEDHEGMFDD